MSSRSPDGAESLPPATGAGATLRRSLRRGPERAALLALLCFRTAEMATWVALLVWAFDERGAGGTGVIALAQLIPATIAAPLGSVLGDRVTHRRALIGGFLLQALGCVVTAILLVGGASFVAVCIASAFLASALSLSRPVYYATLPDIAETPEDLTTLNSASIGVEGVADFLGPALAAIILSAYGAQEVLLAMIGFCIIAAIAALTLPVYPRAFAPHEDDGYLELLRSGIATLTRDRAAALLTILVGVQYIVIGTLDILSVVLAFEVLNSGPGGPGALSAALGAGAVIGAAATVVLLGRRRLAPALVVGAFVTGLPIVAASVSTNLAQAILLFALAGAGTSFLGVSARTLTQRVVAPEVLARVFGLQEALLLGGTAIGTALASGLVALLGVLGAFAVVGFFLPLAALVVWPWVRRLDDRSALPGSAFVLLRRIPMFAVLPQAKLELLAREMSPIAFDEGAVVVRQGDPGEHFYVIEEGSVLVTVDGSRRRALGPGTAFGEIALLQRVPRTATVTAETPLLLQSLDRATFLSVVSGTALSHETAQRSADELLRGPSEEEPPDSA